MKKIQLSVPKPCHENWDVMTSEDKGRFCSSCQKTVIDFSGMSDRQVAEFFKKPKESVCGRFHKDQLEREIEIPRKRIPWVKYFFTITLPAFLVSCKLAGRQALQGKGIIIEQRITGDTVAVPVTQSLQGDVAILPVDTVQVPAPVVGMITSLPVDSAAKPVSPGKVKIQQIKRCKIQAINSDSNGFERPPFVHQPVQIDLNKVDNLSQPLTGIMGGLAVARITTRSAKRKAEKPSTAKPISQPEHFSFKVFPNPISTNTALTIAMENVLRGRYVAAILNSSGIMVQQEIVDLKDEMQQFQVTIKSVAAGIYFLRLQNEATGQSEVRKIMVN